MNATPDGLSMPEFTAAVDKVRAQLAKTATQPSSAYREYCCTANTMPVRGLHVCWDRAGSLAISLAERAHAANDGSKKYGPSTVVTLARELLANAGLHVQSPRNSRTAKLKLQVRIDDPVATLAAVLGQQKAKSLGRVWVSACLLFVCRGRSPVRMAAPQKALERGHGVGGGACSFGRARRPDSAPALWKGARAPLCRRFRCASWASRRRRLAQDCRCLPVHVAKQVSLLREIERACVTGRDGWASLM